MRTGPELNGLDRHLEAVALLDDAPDAMMLVDAEGTIRFASRQAEAVFGYGQADLIGRSVDTLLPEHLRDGHRGHRLGYAAAPGVRLMGAGLELQARRADGSWFPAEISLSPVELDGGRLTLAAVRDVTRNRAVERALRESEGLFRLTFETSPVGMAILGLDGACLSVNPAMCAVTGRTRDELVAMDLSELLPDGPIALDLTDTGTGRAQRQLRRADGSTAWIEVTLVLVRDADGAPRHLVGHFYDITDQRTYQDELQERALSDPLTGLPNRTLLLDRINQALTQLRRRPGRCALFLLDLDRFKTVNDTLGHLAGDELLRQVAARLKDAARSSDTVARLGGDEFALLCTDLPASDEAFSKRLLAAFDEDFLLSAHEGGHALHVGASIGIAACTEAGVHAGVTAMDLYRDADVALYAAKAGGRGRAIAFEPSLRTR